MAGTKWALGVRGLALLLMVLAVFPVSAGTPYQTQSIVLLQPDFVLKERVPSIDSLSGYIKAVQAATEATMGREAPSPASGFVVLAVRPGGRSMVWLDFQPALPDAVARRLTEAIQSVPPFEARGGVVVFALNATLWDAPAAQGFPNPSAWRKAMEGRSEPMEIGDLVDQVWP